MKVTLVGALIIIAAAIAVVLVLRNLNSPDQPGPEQSPS